MRVVAVDWSGASSPAQQRRAVWVADAVNGSLQSLTAGRTRDETVSHLLALVSESDDPRTVIGLDFSFSFPAWWVRELGAVDGPAVWALAAERGEEWLASCEPPFWGRPGRPRPADPLEGLRRTELSLPDGLAGARRPKSTFQIGGAGSVGTGSIRGMASLQQLRAGGVAVWPFDPWPSDKGGGPVGGRPVAGRPVGGRPVAGRPVAAEVYPRWCTGPVLKSRPAERAAYLARRWPDLAPPLAELARSSEDAFDAACTAIVMSSTSRQPGAEATLDEIDRLEGRILIPPATLAPRDPPDSEPLDLHDWAV